MRFGALFLLLLAFAAPAWAQQDQPRTLAVGPNQSWQHAATGMILPSRSAGLTRGEIRDSTADELDVVADYESQDEGITATVYLFRTMTPDPALWFDRALTALMLRPEFGLAGGAPPAAAGFARPGAQNASGMRATLSLSTPELRSTALAIAPLGHFLIKIRMTSSRLDQAALDERMTRFIEGLRWPAPAATEQAAAAIQACPAPLRLRRARLVRGDPADVLMDALIGVALEGSLDSSPPIYCREPGAALAHGVYRPDQSRDHYLIALGDAGIALSVGEALELSGLMGESRGRKRYSMVLQGRDSTSILPSFNRLPPPEQAMAVAFGDRGPTISVSTNDPGGE